MSKRSGRKTPEKVKPRTISKSAPSRFSSVDDYYARQGPVKARTLRAVFDFILKQFPELESKIAWNVPTIHRKGKYVAGISAHKNHLTFSVFSANVIENFAPRLSKYELFKNCFQIPVDWDVDSKLIADLVRARLAELDAEG